MDQAACAICGQPVEGFRLTHKRYIDKIFQVRGHESGYQCQACGAHICAAGKKKDHPFGKLTLRARKYRCPQCDELFVPSHVLLKQDAPVSVELREMLGEAGPSLEPRTFGQINKILEEKKWRKNEELRGQLLEQLRVDGESYIYRCLEDLVNEIEKITPNNTSSNLLSESAKNRIIRIKWLAEIEAAWLFEDGLAEEMLIYIIEQMKENIRGEDENWNAKETPGSIFDLLMTALWQIERSTKSGKSIPTITNILLNDQSAYYRSIAALLLKFITWDSRVVDALIEALKDEKRPVRYHGGSLISPDPPTVQQRAVLSLIEIGDERGLAAVIPIVGKTTEFAKGTDIRGVNSIGLLSEIGLKAPHLLVEELKNRAAYEKDKNYKKLALLRLIEGALDQINN